MPSGVPRAGSATTDTAQDASHGFSSRKVTRRESSTLAGDPRRSMPSRIELVPEAVPLSAV